MSDFLRRHPKFFFAFCFGLGVITDFFFVGILKIIWFAIYFTTYVALAMTLEGRVRRSLNGGWSRPATILFLAGALIAHLIFVNHRRHDTYEMTLISKDPLVLKTSDFPEFLYLSSGALNEKLYAEGAETKIPMETESLRDYDCQKTFIISTVDGVDVANDKLATWTLRINKLGVFTNTLLPTVDETAWPWCKISFYRTN